ncbi:hypothetical protein EXIGLDRAFT_841112 [Exidia glandulosa HHB12029]|uniref:Uncharacterized protein n=1 Tax=Exidia glandulosa HHB12029 TaxID=1314781 RepID=A0A165E2Q6_EXIGL|nr:hypothetical protein EXIGLDRAFT_841112 [Exidia glandulosa HHB12029]
MSNKLYALAERLELIRKMLRAKDNEFRALWEQLEDLEAATVEDDEARFEEAQTRYAREDEAITVERAAQMDAVLGDASAELRAWVDEHKQLVRQRLRADARLAKKRKQEDDETLNTARAIHDDDITTARALEDRCIATKRAIKDEERVNALLEMDERKSKKVKEKVAEQREAEVALRVERNLAELNGKRAREAEREEKREDRNLKRARADKENEN